MLLLKRQRYLSLQVLYQTHTRKIFQSMPGQEIEFVISEFNPKKRRIIGDRKQLLVAEKKKLQEELFARIHVGDVVEGTVKNLTDFGAFIDLCGADGLLHISEMSWGRVENPRKVFNVGDKTKVLIKDIKDDKIALSLKFEDQNPWLNAADKYSVGSVVKGKVARWPISVLLLSLSRELMHYSMFHRFQESM